MSISIEGLVVVAGAGAMGAGIAQIAAAAGHAVCVIDRDVAALERGREMIEASLAQQARRGLIGPEQHAALVSRIRWSTNLADGAQAQLVIEAIVEQLEAKRALLRDLATIVAPSAILASNTSSLSIEALAEGTPGPQRVVGLHFFNPVPAMKLVEVVAASCTAQEVASAVYELMRRWGKRPVQVRDVPGFIVNRVARPYYAEGFVALAEGVPATDIDHALTAAGGFRMGPLALADLIGHDVNYAVAASVFAAYGGHTRFRPQPSQHVLVETGRLGRKVFAGVYDYAGDLPSPNLATTAPAPTKIVAGPQDRDTAVLFRAALEAGLTVLVDEALEPGVLAIDGLRLALGDGRSLARRDNVGVLLDQTRDLATAKTLVMTARDPGARRIAAGFAQALGKGALFVADRPGQIVLRTLAQLANAAADAVADQVADAPGIDEAMLYGANHPEGPLAWARRHGVERVRCALNHIAAETGDPLYRPAPGLAQAADPNTLEMDDD